MSRAPSPFVRRAVLALVITVAATACTGGDATTVATLELTTTAPPTTASTTTTTEPTTTAPPTTIDPRIAEIEATVRRAREIQMEVLFDPTVPVERYEEVFTGELLETAQRSALMARAEGQSTRGEFREQSVATTITTPTSATHVACGIDALEGLDSTGEVIVPADDSAFLRTYELVESDGRWQIERIYFAGNERAACELSA